MQGASVERYDYARRNGLVERLAMAQSPRSGTRILVSQPALERTRIQLFSTVFSRVHCICSPSLVFRRCSEYSTQHRLPALMLVCSQHVGAERAAATLSRREARSSRD